MAQLQARRYFRLLRWCKRHGKATCFRFQTRACRPVVGPMYNGPSANCKSVRVLQFIRFQQGGAMYCRKLSRRNLREARRTETVFSDSSQCMLCLTFISQGCKLDSTWSMSSVENDICLTVNPSSRDVSKYPKSHSRADSKAITNLSTYSRTRSSGE